MENKEILDMLEDLKKVWEFFYISDRERKMIIDYITNLQKENESLQLELSGYRKAILKDDKMLGLQDRIKELETINEKHRELNGTLRKENQILRENAEHNDKVVDKARWNEMIYKTKIEKAIEYIKSHKEERAYYEPFGTPTGIPNRYEYFVEGYYELLEILQGSDKLKELKGE